MDSIIQTFPNRKMERIVPEIWPIFERGAARLKEATALGQHVDVLPEVQLTMAEATLSIFFGDEYNSTDLAHRAVDVAESIAELMGLFQNQSLLARKVPWLWRIYTWISVLFFKIPSSLGIPLGGKIWADMSREMDLSCENENENIVAFLARRYATADGQLSLVSKLWMLALIMTILFASLHQTATIIIWVTYYLALRPESQEAIRKESQSITRLGAKGEQIPPNQRKMQEMTATDSFVREVLRMKGDSVNLVRATTRDVELGGYLIPKGSVLLPVTYLSYRSPDFTPNPDEFDAERWIGSGKSAATTGPGYLAFGLGRWSCPGRILAVLEIKSWILALRTSHGASPGNAVVSEPHNYSASYGPLLLSPFDQATGSEIHIFSSSSLQVVWYGHGFGRNGSPVAAPDSYGIRKIVAVIGGSPK
ncbi:hypothetical protein N7528_002176 [Penicillium herquei]|nr:hypothetical protein N7528_002176 [Penicillium herquei]